MEELIAPLMQIAGISGAAVFAQNGYCLAQKLAVATQERALARLLGEFDATRDICESVLDSRNVEVLSLEFDSGSVIMRKVGSVYLVILMVAESNLALMNVVANATGLALERYQRRPEFQEAMNQAAAAMAELGLENADDEADSAFQVRYFSRENLVIPRDALEESVINRVVEVFGKYAGPRAKAWVYDDLHQLGATPWTLKTAQFADLVRLAAKRIPKESRDPFTRDAYGD